MGRGSVRPSEFFLLLTEKKSLGNQYLKVLDFSYLFVADALMKKKSQSFLLFPPLRALLGPPAQKIFLKILNKKGAWSKFLKDFWKIFKNEDYGFQILKKSCILFIDNMLIYIQLLYWTLLLQTVNKYMSCCF